ncbi:hypothetical protein VCRA2117O328_10200 [Vibrio crassostreae]|nr:hypothetical protein VCRA2117O328_10200 [Vibrio crassostreae]
MKFITCEICSFVIFYSVDIFEADIVYMFKIIRTSSCDCIKYFFNRCVYHFIS